MTRVLWAVLLLVAGCTPSPQQFRWDAMLSALGGRDAIAALRSLSVEANCTGPRGDFRTRVSSLRPNSVHFWQRSEADSVEIWSTPELTWVKSPDGSLESIEPGTRAFLRGHEFHLLLLEIEGRFSAPVVTASNADSLQIAMRDEAGNPAALTLDARTDLPLELTLHPVGAEGPVRIRFRDWRRHGALLYFHGFVLHEGSIRVFTYRYTSIQPNAVDAVKFEIPAPLKLEGSGR